MRKKKQIHFDVPSSIYEAWRMLLMELDASQTDVLTELVQQFIKTQTEVENVESKSIDGRRAEEAPKMGVLGNDLDTADKERVEESEGNASEVPKGNSPNGN